MATKQSVGALVYNDLGELLVLKHKKLGMWTIPGGRVEAGETLLSALTRECREELGITITEATLLRTKECELFVDGSSELFSLNLFGVEFRGEVTNLEPHKHEVLMWVSPQDLSVLDKSEYLKMALE